MPRKFMFALAALSLSTGIHAEVLTDADEVIARADLAAYYGGADGRSECG